MSIRGFGGVNRTNAENLPSAATVTGARNGLSLVGTFVELGGANPLIHNTTVDTDLFRILIGNDDSFLHVEQKIGQLGDFFLNGNGMIITVDNSANRRILMQGGAIALDLLDLDMVNSFYAMGDISNGTSLTIDNANKFFNVDIDSDTYLSLDKLNNIYAIGDLGVNVFGTTFYIADGSREAAIEAGALNSRMLFVSQGSDLYSMGDIDGINNSAFFTINDNIGALGYTFTAGGGRRLLLDVTNGLYQIGDIDAGAGNESYILINDVTQQIFFKDGSLAGAVNGYAWTLADQTTGRGGWAAVPGMAIGSTVTGGTQGSVLFLGAAGILAQDNANFFFDDANNRLGIGINTPIAGIHNAKAGAASLPGELLSGTWFTGGSTTTTKPQLLIEPTGTTSNTWSVSGTGLGLNAAAGFVGNLLDLQISGVSKLSVTQFGIVLGISASTSIQTVNNTITPASGGAGIMITSGQSTNNSSAYGLIHNTATNQNPTSGSAGSFWDRGFFTPSSGTATYTGLLLDHTINQTGGANGITRGLYINPTITAAADFRALEISTGKTVLSISMTSWGGTTAAFPGALRNATGLDFKLADNSGFAPIAALDVIANGNVIATGATSTIRLKGYTVATLPAGTQGDTAFVTDALAPAYLVAVVGGGAVVAPVFYNGAAWVAG